MAEKNPPSTPHASSFYQDFLVKIKERIRSAQYEAFKAVNQELVNLYWVGYWPDNRGTAGYRRLGQSGGETARRRSANRVSRRGWLFGFQPLADEGFF